MTLHERITAKLDQTAEYAERLRGTDRHTHNLVVLVLRGLAEDRSILRRHAPCDDCPAHTVRMACHRCDLPVYRCGYGELGCEWQLSVARRHGIEEAS